MQFPKNLKENFDLYDLGLFLCFATISIGYDNIVVTTDEIGKHIGKRKTDGARHELSDNQTGHKQANSLATLSKPHYLEVRLNVSASEIAVING